MREPKEKPANTRPSPPAAESVQVPAGYAIGGQAPRLELVGAPEGVARLILENPSPCSVELSRSTAGVVTIGVKAYSGTVQAAADAAIELFDRLCVKYPHPSQKRD